MFFDKLWKVYLQKYEICELNKNTFLEVTNMIMEGRHDGEQVTWKWLQENQNIPYSEKEAKKLTYDKVMTIISRKFCGKY